MYTIEMFITNFGRLEYYERFIEYREACDVLDKANKGIFTNSTPSCDVYSAYEIKKKYHNYFKSIENFEDAVKNFYSTDIQSLLKMNKDEIYSDILKFNPDWELNDVTKDATEELTKSVLKLKNEILKQKKNLDI